MRGVPRSGLTPSRMSHAFILLMLAFGAAVLALFFSVLSGLEPRDVAGWAVVVSFVFNGVFSCWALIKDAAARPYSLVQVHWLFFLTFFVVAPLSQYAADYFCWDYPISDASYLTANVLLLVWAMVFSVFSMMGAKHVKLAEENASGFFAQMPQVSRGSVVILVSLSAAATVAIVLLVGLDNLFSRSTFSFELDQTLTLLLDKVLRCTPLFAFVFVFIRFKQSGDCLGALVVCAALLLLADFPFGMARYNAAAVYGGLLLLCTPFFRRCKGLFPLVFLLLFLVVFPAWNVFRANEFDLGLFISAAGKALSSLGEGFSTGDYDAYSMFVRSLNYAESYGPTGGMQLLGALLFFVPRSIWPAKPIGSGAMMASAQGQAFTNISCPLSAEGIVNFGILGVALFAAVLGVLCRKIDRESGSGGLEIFYPFLCFLFFFMLRGDLLSSFAYATGFAAVFYAMYLVVLRSSHPFRPSARSTKWSRSDRSA